MVDYTQAAIRMLKRKHLVQTAVHTLQEQIQFLEEELTSCRTSSYDSIRTGRCTENYEEERRLSIMARLDDCRYRYRVLSEEVEQIERGYSILSPYQQDLLETFFVSGEKNCAERIAGRYYKERSAIYRDRKKALNRFTLAVYGVV